MKNTVIKSVFVLALACSGASCTGNYLEINSNPYEVTEEEMQRKGYAISSYLNAIFGTIISPDVNTTQFTDALLGGTQGGYFADSQNGWKTTISNYNPTNDWTRVFMYSDRIIPVLYSNLMKLNGISEDPIVLSIAKIAKVCAMNRVTDAYGPIPYSEIGISGKIQVPYDTQADVYRQMFDELDEAIEMLTAHSSEAITASTDPVYEGSAEKWCKFANSMKLRLAMRVVYTDFTSSKGKTPRQLAEEAVSNKVGVFTSNSDNAKLPSVAFGKDGNPLRAACLYNQPEGSNTGGDTHAAADIAVEHEDVPDYGQLRVVAQVRIVEDVPLFGSEEERVAVGRLLAAVKHIDLVVGILHLLAPVQEGAEQVHGVDDGRAGE